MFVSVCLCPCGASPWGRLWIPLTRRQRHPLATLLAAKHGDKFSRSLDGQQGKNGYSGNAQSKVGIAPGQPIGTLL